MISLDVYCSECNSLIESYTDTIAEKYPFYCTRCQARCDGMYPWYLRARLEDD